MTDDLHDDELLSAILDGLADEATVASVLADPVAADRLERLRQVANLVGTPPPDPTPERRASSIAAALAAAEPAPEVASLTVERERRIRSTPRWFERRTRVLAVAAAALVIAIAIPIISSLGGGDADTATTATDSASLSAEDTADAADFGTDDGAADDDASSDDSGAAPTTTTSARASAEPEEEAAEAQAAAGDVAADTDDSTADAVDDSAADDAADDGSADDSADTFEVVTTSNIESVLDLIEVGAVAPTLLLDDPVLTDAVAPECLAPFAATGEPAFSLVRLDPGDGSDVLVLVVFDTDGTVQTLDARDCSPIR